MFVHSIMKESLQKRFSSSEFYFYRYGLEASLIIMAIYILGCGLSYSFVPIEYFHIAIGCTFIWVIMELCFFAWLTFYLYYQGIPVDHIPLPTPKEHQLFLSELQSPNSIENLEEYLSGWFYDNDIKQVSKKDVLDWMSVMLYHCQFHTLEQKSQMVQILNFVNQLEIRLQHKFDVSTITQNNKMLMTVDRIEISFRPLLFYLSMQIVARCSGFLYTAYGFERKVDDNMISYYRKGDTTKPSIVFFHGIGIGLSAYTRFIIALISQFPDRTIILMEMPSIAMRLDLSHCVPEEFANSVARRLAEVNSTENIFIGHSLGTVLLRWIDYFHPEIVTYRIFIEPICFSLWTADIAYNFAYRGQDRNHIRTAIKSFAAMEVGIALYLRRWFVWYQNTYFTDTLPENCKIYLSEYDGIVNSEYVGTYLAKNAHHSRKVEIIGSVNHGDLLMFGDQSRILEDIRRLDKYN
ncbi:hypothetical protein BC833DRAFT_582754 [Globomyces pollinis-pini]|nr:hypothetical protein BC833DRAFT_582754 [Globomyces pollinis-pini]